MEQIAITLVRRHPLQVMTDRKHNKVPQFAPQIIENSVVEPPLYRTLARFKLRADGQKGLLLCWTWLSFVEEKRKKKAYSHNTQYVTEQT